MELDSGSSERRDEVMNEEHKTMMVNTIAETAPTTTGGEDRVDSGALEGYWKAYLGW